MEKFFYRVKTGDTLLSVANGFFIPPSVVISDNGLTGEISAGDILLLRKCERVYRVGPLDTEKSIAEKFERSPFELKAKNGVPYFFFGQIIEV